MRLRGLLLAAVAATLLSTATLPGTAASDPTVCPSIPEDEILEERYPTYRYRCISPDTFVKDGADLGFEADPPIDWVRPGMNVGPCSTSFMLTDDAGNLYLTQSAHCVADEQGETFCDATYEDTTTIEGYRPADVVYTSGEHMQDAGATTEECESYDFAIVEIPSDLHDVAHPKLRHVGGPTGLADPLEMRHRDPMVGYGNSDDRGFAVEVATGEDHGEAPLFPHANTFEGYYVGTVLNEPFCAQRVFDICTDPYDEEGQSSRAIHGYTQYVRYNPPKITGDSGSADLTEDGAALGVTSVLNFATGLDGFVPIYDALLKIHVELDQTYYVVTWDAYSPGTIETGP